MLTGIVEQVVSKNEEKAAGGVNFKGTSVNQLRRNVRVNAAKSSFNYKATRKKKKSTKFIKTLDKSQRLIHDFYQSKPNNQVILGSSDDKEPLGSTHNEGKPSKLV